MPNPLAPPNTSASYECIDAPISRVSNGTPESNYFSCLSIRIQQISRIELYFSLYNYPKKGITNITRSICLLWIQWCANLPGLKWNKIITISIEYHHPSGPTTPTDHKPQRSNYNLQSPKDQRSHWLSQAIPCQGTPVNFSRHTLQKVGRLCEDDDQRWPPEVSERRKVRPWKRRGCCCCCFDGCCCYCYFFFDESERARSLKTLFGIFYYT